MHTRRLWALLLVACSAPPTSLSINATAGEGGSIAPATQTVARGANAEITVTPSAGFTVASISGCGGSLSGTTYTTAAIEQSCAVAVAFVATAGGGASHVITAAAGIGGAVEPTTQIVANNGVGTVTVTAEAGYVIASVTGCGGTLEGNTFTTFAVGGNCSISAAFTSVMGPIHAVAAVAGAGGTVAPALQRLATDELATIAVYPDAGYQIASVTGCNGALIGNLYTSEAVSADCSVAATFELAQYTISATHGAGGTLAPLTTTTTYGETEDFTVTPNSGYRIGAVGGCGGTLNGSTFTTAAATGACEVSATFIPTFAITVGASAGGTVAPMDAVADAGARVDFTVTPDAGYRLTGLRGCGGALLDDAFTTEALAADCTVTASFERTGMIYAGDSHTCYRFADGTAKCWGQNAKGQLGVATFSPSAHGDEAGEAPADNDFLTLPGAGFGFSQMDLGAEHTCVVSLDHQVHCFGEGQAGQLGLANTGDRNVISRAVDFDGALLADVMAGAQHTCALTLGGDVYCWGSNNNGELGIGDVDTRFVPTQKVDFGNAHALKVAAGEAHTCALLNNGDVSCWGDNLAGQLGDGDGGYDSTTAVPVLYLSAPATDVASGNRFSCAITGGAVRCWGENANGQLGNNDSAGTDRDYASDALNLGSEIPVKLALGGEHGCVLTVTNKVFCWGESGSGQTGQNGTTDLITPAQLSFGTHTPIDLAAGGNHTCAVLQPAGPTTDTVLHCWGAGNAGQLGLEDNQNIGDDEVIDNNAFYVYLVPIP